MTKPYLTVPFAFSSESWTFLQQQFDPLVLDYQQNAPQPSALVSIRPEMVTAIKQSTAWQEVLKFSAQYGLSEPYPQLFIYKQLESPRRLILGNPHIDTTGQGGIEIDVPVRFNVLLNGDENTEMVWWTSVNRHSPHIVEYMLTRPDGTRAGRLQAVGNGLKEQWDQLGEPDCRCATLAKKQQYASFVRTDVLHALNWTGAAPRLVFSLRYTDPWSVMSAHQAQ